MDTSRVGGGHGKLAVKLQAAAHVSSSGIKDIRFEEKN